MSDVIDDFTNMYGNNKFQKTKEKKKEMNILEIQQRFQDNGFQWLEHIFNDGHKDNCIITFSLSKNPHHFSDGGSCDDASWGRFTRIVAWNKANDWLDKHLT